ncbi:tRNA nucleotidyltransferase [gamma proteobacterium IMCC1989]|nr:tRNA nucleotidyltransferase [gamma proteobacterium IMCC1989]
MKTYLVGGAIRDQLLNFPYHEKDWVVVGSSPEEMIKQGYTPVGKDFPVFLHPSTHEEYALARTERKTAPGYKGFTFHTDKSVTLEDDLQRRDLTINAIAQSDDGTLIDPYGGQQDIIGRCLRHVSSAFSEDPVRVLRVARFAARYHHLGFSIAKETITLMQNMVAQGETQHLVAERVWQEMQKALTEQHPEIFFTCLEKCHALSDLLPKTDEILKTLSPLNTTLLTNTAKKSGDPLIRFSALCYPFNLDDIDALCQHLTVPNEYRELAILTKKHDSIYLKPNDWNSEKLNAFFQQCDTLRKPERFQQLLDTWDSMLNKNSEQKESTDTTAHLLAAAEAYNNVDHQALIKQGFKKAELGNAIKQKRKEQVGLWLKTHQEHLRNL